jgi:UDPglucose 6-dehydrogenase
VRISVIGLGYLGAVHAASLASLGHEVVGVDVDAAKVDALALGKAPFYEPGLDELLGAVVDSGALTVTSDPAAAAGCRVHFVCVGTPQSATSGAADLRYVDAAFAELAGHLAPGDLVVGKSTVPVGTAARLADVVAAVQPQAALAWNPEFLREGFAVEDTLHPDRIVYGVPEGEARERAVALLDEVYATPLGEGVPRIVTDYPTAELVKVAANSFLATKISFINAMAELCEVAGGDVTQLADAIGVDARIGRRFLNAGLGFGGGCLPKDIRAFMASTPATRSRSSARSTASTGDGAPGWSTWRPRCWAGPSTARGSRCSARRSSPTATTCATRPPSTSPPGSPSVAPT